MRMLCFVASSLVLFVLGSDLSAQTAWGERLSLALSPPARSNSILVYDPIRKVSVLFGGKKKVAGGRLATLGDTWEWDGNAWTEIKPAVSPSPRYDAAATWDPLSKTVLLFGGWSSLSLRVNNETWSWNGSTWTQLPTPSGLGSRSGAAMAFDPTSKHVVLYGGRNGSTLGDTWAWNGSSWSNLTPAASPGVRWKHQMITDTVRNQIVLCGGRDGISPPIGDTWTWDGATWVMVPGSGFPARVEHGLIFDPVRRRVVCFGGNTYQTILTSYLNDTLEFDGTLWIVRLAGNNQLTPRAGSALTWDEERGRPLMFGGEDFLTYFGETWEYFHLTPATSSTFGSSCAGSVGTAQLIPADDPLPWVGEDWGFEVRSMPIVPSAHAWGLIGTSRSTWLGMPLPVDLSPIGMTGCSMLTNGAIGLVSLGGSGGKAAWTISIPNDLRVFASKLYLQAVVFDPGANALNLTVTNGYAGMVGLK